MILSVLYCASCYFIAFIVIIIAQVFYPEWYLPTEDPNEEDIALIVTLFGLAPILLPIFMVTLFPVWSAIYIGKYIRNNATGWKKDIIDNLTNKEK